MGSWSLSGFPLPTLAHFRNLHTQIIRSVTRDIPKQQIDKDQDDHLRLIRNNTWVVLHQKAANKKGLLPELDS